MQTLNLGGKSDSASASTALPNPKPATLSKVRMLTPSEIESLRQHKHHVQEVARKRLAPDVMRKSKATGVPPARSAVPLA